MEQIESNMGISQKELSNASHIFARTINLLLEENDGIVVDVTPEVEFDEDVKKVIVFKHNNMIHIQRFDQELDEGSLITLEVDENLPEE
jgi:hypothetical protein